MPYQSCERVKNIRLHSVDSALHQADRERGCALPKCSMYEQEGILQEMLAHLTGLYLASQALCMRSREAAWHTQVRS